jgi:hypothetical protein
MSIAASLIRFSFYLSLAVSAIALMALLLVAFYLFAKHRFFAPRRRSAPGELTIAFFHPYCNAGTIIKAF